MSHPTTKSRRRAGHDEEHENHERWLLTYADMITLLMVLFIVLYALGQVDIAKYGQFASGLSKGFGSPLSALEGGTGPLENTGVGPRPLDLMTAVVPPVNGPALSPAMQKALEDVQEADRRRAARGEADRLAGLKRKIVKALSDKGLRDRARVTIDSRGLVVNVVTDDVLFRPYEAELERDGRLVLEAIAPVLKSVTNDIEVQGHTNSVAVKPRNHRDDVDLSSDRAARVVSFLTAERVAARRIRAVGFGSSRPLLPGTSELANRVNRRVEVVLLSSLPAEASALLPRYAGEQPDSQLASASGGDRG